MAAKKAFTSVELITVVMIVGLLAAVVVPILRGHIDAAKWSEGKAIAGTIASALRIYCADKGAIVPKPSLSELGFKDSDLKGRYFKSSNFKWSVGYDAVNNVATYTVTVNSTGTGINPPPSRWILDHEGKWTPFER